MSYQDIAQGAARELRPVQQAVSPSDQRTKDLIASVFRMRTDVSRLKADVDQLGGPRDTVVLREKLALSNERIKKNAKDIGGQLKQVAAESRTQQTQKLLHDFQAVLAEFEVVMKVASNREAASLPKKPPHIAVEIDPGASQPADELEAQALLAGQRRQEVMQLETELTYNEVLIEERDEAIHEISQQIGEVHEIFQDLATLVNDQGQMIDDISDHIGRTADRTQEANRQLVKAERSQRGARKKKCFLMLMAAVVLGVLLLVLIA